MVFQGGFLLPAPALEPALLSHSRPLPCRNRVIPIAARRRSGTVALERVLQASHAAKSPTSDELRAVARQFAGAVLRLGLEVLDGRRSPAQLRPLADVSVIAALTTLVASGAAPGNDLGVATLTRLDVTMTEPGVGEVCAAYDRGTRHFALAARIVRGRSGWRLTAFRVC